MSTVPNNNAAIWSAIAATFAALSSFMIMLIQRRSLLESVRPELVITGWNRRTGGQGDSVHDVITFQTIKNVGRGVAFHVYLSCSQEVDNRPTAILSTTRLPLVATNEGIDVNGEILIWWKNVEPKENGAKYLPVTINIFCWDSRGRRHETRYSLLAIELSRNVGVADEIAPGVMLGTRTTMIRSVWLLKLRRTLGRIPLLGRPFRKSV